jgi:AMP nucleosidase
MHYTGTPTEHFQRFVLFTNYVRYVDEFVDFAIDELRRADTPYRSLSVPGGIYRPGDLDHAEAEIAGGNWRRHQMPAYHLMGEGGGGITLVNIGVAYLRDDHLLDDVLPVEIPLPAIAEVQRALFEAAMSVTGEDEDSLKKRLRTGTVVTTDDRNWELRYTLSALRFNQSRAVGIDMESATVAAQGYRFRVPYGTLLCVSDKPLHGELKLPGQANAFYDRAISQHLRIGIEALLLLKREGDALHSRKLRSFDEPPFR